MQSEQRTNGRGPHSSDPAGERSNAEALRTASLRQAVVIDTLSEAVSNFQSATKALKAENTELRADNERMRVRELTRPQTTGRDEMQEPLQVVLPADVSAPGAARRVVVSYFGELVAPSVLDSARLLISELVTNSVQHSGVVAGEQLTIRVGLGQSWCRLEVEDAGHEGFIAPRPPGGAHGGGLGLNLVQTLSERWGLERVRDGGTRVWAQLSRAPVVAVSEQNGTRPSPAVTA
jgi:anti-sigma regulatory factor (Ser/Thr protein kinase)